MTAPNQPIDASPAGAGAEEFESQLRDPNDIAEEAPCWIVWERAADGGRPPPALTTIEVTCPIPDCGSIVYAPDSDNARIDCLDCGAALLTLRGIDGAVTLEVTDDPVVTNDLKAQPPLAAPPRAAPPLGAGPHVAAFDASAPSDDPGWQRTDNREKTHG